MEENLENQQQQIIEEKNVQQELPQKPKETIYQQKILQNYWRFVMTCICFAFFYVLGTYKIDTGLGVFLSSLGEMACCFSILKQWDITMKKKHDILCHYDCVNEWINVVDRPKFFTFLAKKNNTSSFYCYDVPSNVY